MTRSENRTALHLKGQATFRDRYLLPALQAGLIEMTIPGKPLSSKQQYHLTDKYRGRAERHYPEEQDRSFF